MSSCDITSDGKPCGPERNIGASVNGGVVMPWPRFSSKEPALQNIPVRTELGKKLRDVFRPEAERVFIECDYAGLELRVAAMCVFCERHFLKKEETTDDT